MIRVLRSCHSHLKVINAPQFSMCTIHVGEQVKPQMNINLISIFIIVESTMEMCTLYDVQQPSCTYYSTDTGRSEKEACNPRR